MNKIWKLGLVLIVLTVCLGCDRATKMLARESLAFNDPISLLDGAIRLEYAENPGALLSLGSNLPEQARFLLLVVFVGLVLAVTLAVTIKTEATNQLQLVALSLIVGGGAGNLIDRLQNKGNVVDFVSLGIGPLRTGIFNMADVAITAGILIFMLLSTRIIRQASKVS